MAEDPKVKLAGYPEKTRAAIAAMKVTPGMTREQVLMALGYPISSENPKLDAPVWRYWLDTWAEVPGGVRHHRRGRQGRWPTRPVLTRVSLP